VPVGAHATHQADGTLLLHGQVTSLDGAKRVTGTLSGSPDAPEALGAALAGHLRDQGADALLAEIRGTDVFG
jgi:hydroxymethylbilane synthase